MKIFYTLLAFIGGLITSYAIVYSIEKLSLLFWPNQYMQVSTPDTVYMTLNFWPGIGGLGSDIILLLFLSLFYLKPFKNNFYTKVFAFGLITMCILGMLLDFRIKIS